MGRSFPICEKEEKEDEKAGMLVAIVAAMALALCLTGCGPRLDSEKTLEGMTYSVPSDWGEVSLSSASSQMFAKDGNIISVSVDAIPPYGRTSFIHKTPEDSLEQTKKTDTSSPLNGEDWNAEKVSESVIDNVPCVVYEVSFKTSASGEESVLTSQTAYLYKSDAHYELTISGDAVKMDDLLKTVSIS